MKILDIFSYAFKSLRTAKMRSYLTIIGVVIGVIAMVVVTSISEGLQRDIRAQLSSFGTDKMFIVPTATVNFGRSFGGPVQSATSGKLFQKDVNG
ncbi:ABC transporter permease, partial [Candidatus Micrarchaeota archaeon]|nr:ABC transporter permease [Candidatus Micrarchaeota archaeon]